MPRAGPSLWASSSHHKMKGAGLDDSLRTTILYQSITLQPCDFFLLEIKLGTSPRWLLDITLRGEGSFL